jgi:hypothetical protein
MYAWKNMSDFSKSSRVGTIASQLGLHHEAVRAAIGAEICVRQVLQIRIPKGTTRVRRLISSSPAGLFPPRFRIACQTFSHAARHRLLRDPDGHDRIGLCGTCE